MEWLTRGWDQGHVVSVAVGVAAGVALVLLEASILAEVAALIVCCGTRWALWQIPPPGQVRAPHAPPDAWTRVCQVAIVVLAVTLLAEVTAAPLY